MFGMLPYSRRSGLSDLFDQFEREFFEGQRGRLPSFCTDIRDAGDCYILQADLPGFSKEEIEIDLKEGLLTISAAHEECREQEEEQNGYLCRERRYGSFRRAFNLSGIQEEEISAAYENGVLTLKLPKVAEQLPQTRKIAIQ